jgi:FkbM family methyltransferase
MTRLLSSTLASEAVQRRVFWHLSAGGRSSIRPSDSAEFFAFVLSQHRHSYAQLYQDLWVLWSTQMKRSGYFVEFGATNGRDLSNTYLLEKTYGWRGLLAEPFPHWHAELRANRSAIIDHRCVWKASGEELSFLATDTAPELAGLESSAFDDRHSGKRRDRGRGIAVKTVSLLDLLAEHQAPDVIDYLSIDTEGSELTILEAFDFSRYRIGLITVEHNDHAEKREGIRQLLQRNGFTRRFEQFSRFDDWYVNESA